MEGSSISVGVLEIGRTRSAHPEDVQDLPHAMHNLDFIASRAVQRLPPERVRLSSYSNSFDESIGPGRHGPGETCDLSLKSPLRSLLRFIYN